MPSWKKIVTSGSKAQLSQVSASSMLVKDLVVSGSGTLTVHQDLILAGEANAFGVTSGGTGLKSVGQGQFLVGTSADTFTAVNTSSIAAESLAYDNVFAKAFITASSQGGVRDAIGLGTIVTQDANSTDLTGDSSIVTTGNISSSGNVTFNGENALTNNTFTGSFSGDGSALTGIVTNLNLTGSDNSKDAIDLKTGGLTFAGSGDITSSVASDTITTNINPALKTVTSITNDSLVLKRTNDDSINFGAGDITVEIAGTEKFGVTTTGIDVAGKIEATGDVDIDGSVSASNISSSGHLGVDAGANIHGTSFVQGDNTIGLFVENTVSASGFKGNFFEITSSTLITSESTEFGNSLDDEHIFSGSIVLTSSAQVTIDATELRGGVGTTFSASLVDSPTGNFDSVDIDGGTIDGATIATSDITVGAGKSIDVSSGGIKLGAGQLTASNIAGGTFNAGTFSFNGSTISDLGTVTTANIDGGTIDGGGSAGGLKIGSGDAGGYGQGDAEVHVTGSFTGSFVGDGTNLTGIVSTLSVAADSGTNTFDLKTDTLTFDGDSNTGVSTTIFEVDSTNARLEISNSLATDSQIGAAKFNSSDFSVSSGDVTIKDLGVGNSQLEHRGVSMSADKTVSSPGRDLGETMTFSGTSNQIHTTASAGTVTIGLPADVTITNDLTVTNALSVNGNVNLGNATSDIVTIAGDLVVQGNTTTVSAQDLKIEDSIILIGSGSNHFSSNNIDTGIVFERSGGSNHSQSVFFFDESKKRFSVGNVNEAGFLNSDNQQATDQSLFEHAAYVVTAVTASGIPNDTRTETATSEAGHFGAGGDASVGQISIDTETGEVYIYT